MAINSNSVLQMYLLMGVTQPQQQFLKKRYPNVTFVLQYQDPNAGGDPNLNQDLFKQVDPNVYAAFHKYLVGLNNGSTTPPATVEHTQLEGAYTMAGSMITLTDLAFSAAPAVPWPGGSQHPPSPDVVNLFNNLS
jgi:uncharacterized protein (DUF608 family)